MNQETSSGEASGSALLRRLQNHRAMMSPAQKQRRAGKLLLEATAEIDRLVGICTHVHDRLLRGEDDLTLMAKLAEGWHGPDEKPGHAAPNRKHSMKIKRQKSARRKARSAPSHGSAVDWQQVAADALDALRSLNAHYADLCKSNPGFMGTMCLQDYALWNESLLKSETVLRRYAHLPNDPAEPLPPDSDGGASGKESNGK